MNDTDFTLADFLISNGFVLKIKTTLFPETKKQCVAWLNVSDGCFGAFENSTSFSGNLYENENSLYDACYVFKNCLDAYLSVQIEAFNMNSDMGFLIDIDDSDLPKPVTDEKVAGIVKDILEHDKKASVPEELLKLFQ